MKKRLSLKAIFPFFIVIGIMTINTVAFSQVKENSCDTVNIVAPAYLILNDTSIHLLKDSTAIVCNKYIVISKSNGYGIYEKIVGESKKHELVDKLFQLIIASSTQDTMLMKQNLMKAEDAYSPYSGKIIRNIKIQVLDPFGASISDTNLPVISSWGKALNKSHINTRKKTIEKKLMFNKNDEVDPLQLVENTNELSSLPYLQDATIIVTNSVGDSVDILVLAKDKFPWVPGIDIYGANHFTAYIKNVNIVGLGQSLGAGITMDTRSKPLFYLSDINYFNNNLYKQITSAVNYHISDNSKIYQLLLNRDIVPLSVRAGGGLEVSQTEENIVIDPTYVDNSSWYFKYRYYELWASYLFYDNSRYRSLKRINAYIVPCIAYYKKEYLYRPVVSIDTNSQFTNYTHILGNFALVKQKYYRTNFLMSFGKAEYIPYGFQAAITGGYTWTEFLTSPYFGLNFATTVNFRDVGYFFGNFAIGSHYSDKFTEGAVNLNFSFLSSIFKKDRYRYRFLASIKYTNGINRYSNNLLYLGEDYGFIGMRDEIWYGQKRLFIELNTISYTPWYIFGFRFAAFAFCSAGFIGDSNYPILKNQLLTSFGVGIYSKNDFLAFNSFQLRVAYFPITPSDISHFGVSLSTIGLIDQLNFLNTKPKIVDYK